MSALQLEGQPTATSALLPARAAHPSPEAALFETLDYLVRLQEGLWQSARDVAGYPPAAAVQVPGQAARRVRRARQAAAIQGARELERGGVRAITTNCGFLAMFQRELAAAVSVPVFTSTLMLVPLVAQ